MTVATRDEIYSKVKAALVDALSVDEDEVTMDATLMGDLQAESIDILDIQFRLEKAFNIKIPQGELVPADVLNNPSYVSNKKLNAAGLAALKERMPHADFSGLEQDPDIDKIFEAFTVGTIVNFIEMKLKKGG